MAGAGVDRQLLPLDRPTATPRYLDQRVYRAPRGGCSRCPSVTGSVRQGVPREWDAEFTSRTAWLRLHGPARARRSHPRRVRPVRRLRPLLPQRRHQTGPRGPGRTVGLGRGGVQLAAAPPSRHLLAHRRRHRARAGRRGDRLVLRPRPVHADEGDARRSAPPGQRDDRTRVRLHNRSEQTADLLVVGQRRRGGSRATTSASSRGRARTWPTTRGGRSPRSRGRPSLLRRGLPGPRRDHPAATTSTGTGTSRSRPRTWSRTPGQGFFGGYDHATRAGFVHWSPTGRLPGKKQWTWGNAPFGHAWDRNLTDDDGPYVELMAGVYTDNQPDFAYLAPGETKVLLPVLVPDRARSVRCTRPPSTRRAGRHRSRTAHGSAWL